MLLQTAEQPGSSAIPGISWNLANEYPATSLPSEGDGEFARRVAQLTDGRVRINPCCDGLLGLSSRQQFDAISSGAVVLADSFAGALGDVHVLFQLSSLPFLTASTDDARRLFELARPHYDTVLQGHGQKLLYASPWPPTGLWTKFAPSRVRDLQDLRVRTYDAMSADVFAPLGARSSVVAFADALALLASGGIDAVLSSGDGGAGAKLWERLPHFTPLDYAVPLSLTTIHRASWEALDATLQRSVLTAAAATMQSQWRRMQTRVNENVLRLRAAGATLNSAISTEFRAAFEAAAAQVIAAWLERAGPEGRALLAAYRRGY